MMTVYNIRESGSRRTVIKTRQGRCAMRGMHGGGLGGLDVDDVVARRASSEGRGFTCQGGDPHGLTIEFYTA